MSYHAKYESQHGEASVRGGRSARHEGIRWLTRLSEPLQPSQTDSAWLREGATRHTQPVTRTALPAAVSDALTYFHACASDTTTLTAYLMTGGADTEYALRLCRDRGRHEAVVLLLKERGAFEDAARHALTHQLVDVARTVVSEGGIKGEAARRLWLDVAANGSGNGKGKLTVHDAMVFLQDGPADLRLEHLLDRLDSHTVAHDLKELVAHELSANAAACTELRKALEAGVQRSAELAAEIAEATSRADGTSTAAAGASSVADGAPALPSACSLCRKPLLAKQRALAFDCGHAFHTSCYGIEHECLLCGYAIIDTIDMPFL